nr:MAG TPA: hypothetical protein [Caudoviricetes sp.]
MRVNYKANKNRHSVENIYFYTKIRLYAGREQVHNYIEMKTRKKS